MRAAISSPSALIFYEMLTGKRAFQKATSVETMTAILNEDPPAISQVLPSLSPGLQKIVSRCLAKKPEQRFQHASDLGFALEASVRCEQHSDACHRPAGCEQKMGVGRRLPLSASQSAQPSSCGGGNHRRFRSWKP